MSDPDSSPDDLKENIHPSELLLCRSCGQIKSIGAAKCDCQGSFIKINRVDLGRKQTLRRCVSCSVRPSGGVVYRFLTGQDAPVSVLADALYQHVPASKVIEKDELPGHGRKMLNFTDSRQNAAFFAPYLERAHERNLRRRLIMLTLEKDLEASSGQLRLPSVMERVMFRTNEEKVFPVNESDQDQEKRAATWLMQEFSPPLDRRISLEGLGLLRFEPDIPENWKVPMLAQYGGTADNAKAFKGIGGGVFEIVERYQTNAYRLIYAVQIGEKIYVLHAFQKKSKTGIKTPIPDVELVKQRYRLALELARGGHDGH